MKKEQSDEEIYLNPKTSLNKKLEIMDKVVCRLFTNASRWDNVSFDDEKTAYKVANYDFYLNNTYLCQVENKEEMYIEYLKCYLNALSDPFFIEEVPLEDEFIRQKCKEANLLNYYYSYYFKRKKSKSDFIIFSKSTNALSQWYKCKFEDNEGIIYNSAEQYMMAKKALLFKDEETYHKIMEEDDLSSIKKYGREIRSFDNIIWDKYKEDIVYKANFFKFFQNEELKIFLKSTGNKVIVEANPNDNIWSCGLKPDDENIYNEEKWKGQNLLGKIIMQVRDVIYEDDYRNVNDILIVKS
jgi:ribA/ribD-fused uncharacterized protein